MSWLSTRPSAPIVLPVEYMDTRTNAPDLAGSAIDLLNFFNSKFFTVTEVSRPNSYIEKFDYFWSIDSRSTGAKAQRAEGRSSYWGESAVQVNYISDFESKIQEQINLLSNKVDNLTRAIGGLLPAPTTQRTVERFIDYRSEVENTSAAALDTMSQAEIFNLIADGVILPPADTFERARVALEKGDTETRASAGRALASVDPQSSIDILKTAIAVENHRFVRSILKGALRLAQA